METSRDTQRAIDHAMQIHEYEIQIQNPELISMIELYIYIYNRKPQSSFKILLY